jgi:hypothetical protein
MRTQDEIVNKIRGARGFLDFTTDALLHYLDFEHAREFLKPEATAEEWAEIHTPVDDDKVIAEMRDYMSFAWEKVEDHRGISASRSVDKMAAWAWLLGDGGAYAAIEGAGFTNYGAPKLAAVCVALGFPIPDDEGVQRMIAGQACGAYDGCGCGQ